LVATVVILLQLLMWAIIIRAILSWFPISPSNPIIVILNYITEPIIAPLRRIVPRIGMIDLTPFVAIVILMIITWLLDRLVL
jgi:YggT family protein